MLFSGVNKAMKYRVLRTYELKRIIFLSSPNRSTLASVVDDGSFGEFGADIVEPGWPIYLDPVEFEVKVRLIHKQGDLIKCEKE